VFESGGDSNVALAIFKGLMAKSGYSLITQMTISRLCWRGLRSGMSGEPGMFCIAPQSSEELPRRAAT
jgi:hypothetical protein